MSLIFYTHSKHDKKILDYFDSLFARTRCAAFRASLEEFPRGEDPSKTIEDAIKESVAVFVLLGSGILKSQYTMSWVGYEVGLAKAWAIPVWVLEWENDLVDFPTPHVNHYIRYSVEESRPFFRELIETFKAGFFGFQQPIQFFKRITSGKNVSCGRCDVEFKIYQELPAGWNCPACRKKLARVTL